MLNSFIFYMGEYSSSGCESRTKVVFLLGFNFFINYNIMITELRFAGHPDDVKSYDTTRLRKEFLIEKIFVADEILLVYSLYDRYMVGGAMPVKSPVKLDASDELKADYFLERREMGMINVGGPAIIETKDASYDLAYKEALYLGKETAGVVFRSQDPANPAKLYINSAPAHHKYPSKKVTLKDAEVVVDRKSVV